MCARAPLVAQTRWHDRKHSAHAITDDVTIGETAKAAQFFRADGVILTGTSTAAPTGAAREVIAVCSAADRAPVCASVRACADPAHVAEARKAVPILVAVGSGIDPLNLPALWPLADVFIVGSASVVRAHTRTHSAP